MSLGTYRLVGRLQPGWLVHSADGWLEIRTILTFESGLRVLHFTDGTRAELPPDAIDVRVITNAEKRMRREALGARS